MADIQAKMVRTLSPAGVSIGYQAYCGDSHWPQACPITLIKKMIDRGVLVYEQIPATKDTDATELLLTLENYDQDNGGEEVPEDANIIPDLELEVETRHAAERQEWLTNKGLEIKDRQDTLSKEFLGITDEEDSTDDTTTTDPESTLSGDPLEDEEDNP